MLASLALATVLQTPTAFVSSFSVRETTRLALTPKLDGKLSEEEWDRFAIIDGVQTYFQWQPGKLHGAATLPVGKDLVASFDLQGDGWLVGADNVEVRISWNKGAPTVRERILDATEVSQPKWVEVATADATAWNHAPASAGAHCVTDINTQNSLLLVCGAAEFLQRINFPLHAPHIWVLPGVVSRKKQLLPYLTHCLKRMRAEG